MKLILAASLVGCLLAFSDIPTIPKSTSPDGKLHAIMDVDRDPRIVPEWKEDSFPMIELTDKATGDVLESIAYFGSVGDDERPLREHIKIFWRPDSTAFALTINDRFYSYSIIYARNEEQEFVQVPIPTSYKELTGFDEPDVKHLRPRGRNTVDGWDKDGNLIYKIFLSPMPSFSGNDPLRHKVLLEVSATKMKPVAIQHEKGEWKNGDWIAQKK